MIIAVCNQKGGVGKTTTTAALALNLGKMGTRVLVVDMDPQANCTTALGLTADVVGDACNMFDAIEELVSFDDIFVKVAPGVTLAPSHISLAAVERSLHQKIDRERVLARLLRPYLPKFDVIFLDSPPSLGVFTYNVLAACDTILVPIQSEPLALDGITLLLHTIEDVRNYELNPKCEVGGVVLTMYDQRRNVDKRVLAAVKDVFSDVVFETTIPRDVRLVEFAETANAAILDGDSQGAVAYRELAKEVAARWLE